MAQRGVVNHEEQYKVVVPAAAARYAQRVATACDSSLSGVGVQRDAREAEILQRPARQQRYGAGRDAASLWRARRTAQPRMSAAKPKIPVPVASATAK